MSVPEILLKYREAFIHGVETTFRLAGCVWLSGFIGGWGLGLLAYRYRFIGKLVRTTNFLLGGIPVLVLLFWLHYPLQTLLRINVDPFFTTVLTLSLINMTGIAVIICAWLYEIPRQYREVATVCNVRQRSIFLKIELPLVLRLSLPPVLMQQVNMLHLTLFGSLISVEEIFRVCQQVNAQVYQPVEVYSALALFFLLISLPLNGLALYCKKKLKFVAER